VTHAFLAATAMLIGKSVRVFIMHQVNFQLCKQKRV